MKNAKEIPIEGRTVYDKELVIGDRVLLFEDILGVTQDENKTKMRIVVEKELPRLKKEYEFICMGVARRNDMTVPSGIPMLMKRKHFNEKEIKAKLKGGKK